MKRIVLFVLTNLAVLLVLGAVLALLESVFGVHISEERTSGLIIMAALFGFGGSFISLLMSKWIAKRSMGVRVIQSPGNESEAWLLNTVHRLAGAAGIGAPEVGVFDSPDLNAFATGARRDASLVAVSSGLLARMSRPQAEAVLGHEISHVANGDMVTLTLIQGVVNTFVIFLSRIVGSLIDRAVFRDDRDGGGIGYFVSTMVAQLVLGIAASMIVMAFSRWREFRADRGGANLSGKQNMIGALRALKTARDVPMPEGIRAFAIHSSEPGRIMRLFMSHPPLDERIAALEK